MAGANRPSQEQLDRQLFECRVAVARAVRRELRQQRASTLKAREDAAEPCGRRRVQ